MAKIVTPTPESPAPEPGAPPSTEETSAPVAPEVAPDPEVPSVAETTEADPAAPPTSDPATSSPVRTYRVNWNFDEFKGQKWSENDLVEATEEEAAPFLGGVLSLEA